MFDFLRFIASAGGGEKDSPSTDTSSTPESEHKRLLEENRRMIELLEEREKTLREQEQIIEDQKRAIEEKEHTIEECERVIEEKKHTIEETERVLDEKKRALGESEKTIEESQKTIKKSKRIIEKKKELIRKLKEELRLLRNKGKTEKTPRRAHTDAPAPTDTPPPSEGDGQVPGHVREKAGKLKGFSDEKKKQDRKKKAEERAARRAASQKSLPIFAERTVPLPESCPCCRSELKDPFKMERAEKFCAVPAPIQRVVTYKPTAICSKCNTFVYAADLDDPFPKTQFHETLAAEIIVEKTQDGMPLHRIKEALARHGVQTSEDALEDMFLKGADILASVARYQTERVANSEVVGADATTIRIRIKDNEGKSSYHRGSFCVAMNMKGEVAAEASPDQSAKGFKPFLGSLKTFVCDGAAIFPPLIEGANQKEGRRGIQEANCNSHARRKFYEALGADPVLAEGGLVFYQALYAVEAQADLEKLTSEARQRLRDKEARPVMDDFKLWCEQVLTLRKPGDRIYKAVQYVLKRWDKLTLYLSDGKIPIDTNSLERLMKLIARGRKNFMHASSLEGAEACARYYSLVFTCINLGINPNIYLADVLRRAYRTLHTEHKDLVPARWKELYEKEAMKRYGPPAPPSQEEITRRAA